MKYVFSAGLVAPWEITKNKAYFKQSCKRLFRSNITNTALTGPCEDMFQVQHIRNTFSCVACVFMNGCMMMLYGINKCGEFFL